MIEFPLHLVLDDDIIYIVGATGSGKSTIAKEILKIFNGPKAVVSKTPEEYYGISGVKIFDDLSTALRNFGAKMQTAKKLLIIDENAPVDIDEFHPVNTTVIVLTQKYEPFMRGHTILFLRLGTDQLENIPIKNKKLLEHAPPGFGVLWRGTEIPVYFYI